ncbi:MAG: hypothetical protein AAGB28_17145, partial [Pseudomonadota bacterium]
MQDEVLATVQASSPRRWSGLVMLTTIGALVIYVALATSPELFWQVFLLLIGGGALWLAQRLWYATLDQVVLTQSELRTGAGYVIASVEDIEAVDRSIFAFKPSNGFLIRTRSRGLFSWAPGLWWRIGRRIGIGGVTAAGEAKFMSEVLSIMLAEREG